MSNTRALYEIFMGKELEVAELIQRRRLQMLVHSCIYYNMDQNIVSDAQWSRWGAELADLQNRYPEISRRVEWAEYFKDWDGSSGAFLPLDNEWVKQTALKVLEVHNNTKKQSKPKTHSLSLF